MGEFLQRVIENAISSNLNLTYLILFLIIFCETGLVVMPFLPGDSLLFAIGMFCHPGVSGKSLNLPLVVVLLASAAILGDQVNYRAGKYLGRRVFRHEHAKLFKRSHLVKTEEFFARHGGKTVVLARFVPIVRTFAPFVAGMGAMSYGKFCLYSIGGAFLWVIVCVGAGYLFGSIPVVRQNFEIGILALIVLSVIPMLIEYRKHKRAPRVTEALAEEPQG